jgi:hypothetical protein
MIHDHVASVVSLAKSILFGLDRSKIDTSLPTAQLVLLLDTLIDLGSAPSPVADSANRAVMGIVAAMTEGARSAHETWQKQAEAEAALVEQSARKHG